MIYSVFTTVSFIQCYYFMYPFKTSLFTYVSQPEITWRNLLQVRGTRITLRRVRVPILLRIQSSRTSRCTCKICKANCTTDLQELMVILQVGDLNITIQSQITESYNKVANGELKMSPVKDFQRSRLVC